MVISLSKWKGMAEDTGASEAAGQRADEVEGVDLDAFAVDAIGPFCRDLPGGHEKSRPHVPGLRPLQNGAGGA